MSAKIRRALHSSFLKLRPCAGSEDLNRTSKSQNLETNVGKADHQLTRLTNPRLIHGT
jgi:hypothetical protein